MTATMQDAFTPLAVSVGIDRCSGLRKDDSSWDQPVHPVDPERERVVARRMGAGREIAADGEGDGRLHGLETGWDAEPEREGRRQGRAALSGSFEL